MGTDTVAGLGVRRWSGRTDDGPVVLALHGLTATSAVWDDLARRTPLPVVAPDLPGRGASVAAPAGPGLTGLAEAVLDVVDALGLQRVVVVGHSMGAFLAPLVTDGLGSRAVGTVLLDGGAPPARSLLHRPFVVRALLGLQLRRLVRAWTSVDAYTAAAEGRLVVERPDLRDGVRAWSEAVLRPHGGALRPALDPARVVADGVDSLCRPAHLPLLRRATTPVHLLAASHGADGRRAPFLSDEAVTDAVRLVPRLGWQRVPATHASLLFDAAVAAAVRRVADGGGTG
ncbi:alpha/beta fold hydrolase [Aquipuribacter sp. SD81]|uniref:alpha/beta fold hydrolase n=1 Tax=Aquipuribacter sp. SD81 TaxID=3127703 RepID=UPI003016F2D8